MDLTFQIISEAFDAFLPGGLDNPEKLESLRELAMQQYQQAACTSTDERYCFNASTASIIKVEEGGGAQQDSFTLTIFARNPFGEYFMFTTTSPFEDRLLKYVAHRVARVVLEDAYVEPGT